MTNTPLILAAHGTRDPEGVAECEALARRVASKLPDTTVTLGYVELVEPTIDVAVEEALQGRQIDGDLDAVVVPLMMTTGAHVREDIPEAIDDGRGAAAVQYARPLAPSPRLMQALEQRIQTALETDQPWQAKDTACVIVGRGSLVPEANANHVQMARMVYETTELARVEPAFIQVTRPAIPEALNSVYDAGSRQIVVAQHFLFPGKLRTWLSEQVEAWASQHPDAQVRIAEVIGDCDELADLVIDRYREQLDVEGLDDAAPGYLASLFLKDRDVLVVGGGNVAARRVPKLLAVGAKVRVIAPNVGIKVGRLAAAGSITWEQRAASATDVNGAWYVLAASNDPKVNATIAEEAERQHIFCVRADDATSGTAATPATASAGGLTVAVVGDRNPKRSVRVRDELLKVLQG